MQPLSNSADTTTGTTEAELLRDLSKFLQEAAFETEPSNEEIESGSSGGDVNAKGAFDKAFAELWELCASGTPSTAGSSTATTIPPQLPGLQPAPALFPNGTAQRPAATATSSTLRPATQVSSPALALLEHVSSAPRTAALRNIPIASSSSRRIATVPSPTQRYSPPAMPQTTGIQYLCDPQPYTSGSRVQGAAPMRPSQRSGPLPVVPRSASNGGIPTHANYPQTTPELFYNQPATGLRPIVLPVLAPFDLSATRPAATTSRTGLGPSSAFPPKASPTTHNLSTDIAAVPRPAPVPSHPVPRPSALPLAFPLLMRNADRPAAPRSSLELAEQMKPIPQRASVLRPSICTIEVKAATPKKRSGTKRKASAVDADVQPPVKRAKVTRKTKPVMAGPGPRTIARQEARRESNAEISSVPSSGKTSRNSDAERAPVPTNTGSSSELLVLEDIVQGLDTNAFDELWQLLESPLEESNDNSQ